MREEGDSSNTGSPVGGAHASTGNREDQHLGQSLRGSSDLHAWTDSACYLVRRPDDRLQLTVEHRSAPAPDSLLLRLSGGGDQPLSLLVESADAPPPPLAEAVRAALRSARQPLSRTVLRQRPTPARQQRSSRCRPPNSPTTRPRRPQPQRLAPAGMIRTVRCLLALIRPLFRCSTRSAPRTHSERNDHRHTPRHLSCNQPRPGARNATPSRQERDCIHDIYRMKQKVSQARSALVAVPRSRRVCLTAFAGGPYWRARGRWPWVH